MQLLERRGDFEAAAEHYRRALALDWGSGVGFDGVGLRGLGRRAALGGFHHNLGLVHARQCELASGGGEGKGGRDFQSGVCMHAIGNFTAASAHTPLFDSLTEVRTSHFIVGFVPNHGEKNNPPTLYLAAWIYLFVVDLN